MIYPYIHRGTCEREEKGRIIPGILHTINKKGRARATLFQPAFARGHPHRARSYLTILTFLSSPFAYITLCHTVYNMRHTECKQTEKQTRNFIPNTNFLSPVRFVWHFDVFRVEGATLCFVFSRARSCVRVVFVCRYKSVTYINTMTPVKNKKKQQNNEQQQQ